MKKLIALLVVVMVSVMGLAPAASAGWGAGVCRKDGPPPQLSPDKCQSKAELLGLTDEQSAKIVKIQQDHFNKTRDLRSKLQNSMFDLKQLRWQKNPGQGTLNAKINEVNSLRSELYKESQKCREQINSVLTPEQREKLSKQRSGCNGPDSGGKRGRL